MMAAPGDDGAVQRPPRFRDQRSQHTTKARFNRCRRRDTPPPEVGSQPHAATMCLIGAGPGRRRGPRAPAMPSELAPDALPGGWAPVGAPPSRRPPVRGAHLCHADT